MLRRSGWASGVVWWVLFGEFAGWENRDRVGQLRRKIWWDEIFRYALVLWEYCDLILG